MRILTKNDVERIMTTLLAMQTQILTESEAMNGNTAKELSASIRDVVRKIGGQYGEGVFASGLVSYWMGDDFGGRNHHEDH